MRELKCVKIAKTNPDKKNKEGKIELATDIIEEMFEEELNEFLKEWGYGK